MLLALAVTISLAQLTVALNYELEPRNNNTVCPERHLCHGSEQNGSATGRFRRYCNCDSLCEAFDDCCDDYVRRASSNRSELHRLYNVTSCKYLKFTKDTQFHYVVDRCPMEFERNFIQSNCIVRDSNSENTFTRVPVVGRQSMILYRNVYCAFCNGEQNVVFSKGHVDVQSKYSKTPEITLDKMTFLPPDGYSFRTCIDAIRSCHPNYRDYNVKHRCTEASQSNSYVNSGKGTYLEMVKHMIWEPKYYRNADCAKCNFVNESKQMCSYQPDDGAFYPGIEPIYTHLISFSENTIKTVEGSRGKLLDYKTFSCNSGQLYDPIQKQCRSIFCPSGGNLTAKGCIQNAANGFVISMPVYFCLLTVALYMIFVSGITSIV